jgi:hypothetical protein
MTYLTEEDWEKYLLPKLTDDESFSEELNQIKKCQNIMIIILDILFKKAKPSQLKTKQKILYCSMVFYYKYTLFYGISLKDLGEIERLILCSACLLLGFKAITFKIFDIQQLSLIIHEILNNSNKKLTKEELKDEIMQKEFDLLNALGFDINIDIPYSYFPLLSFYLKKCNETNNYVLSEINVLLNEYVQNSMLFPLYLYYSPYEIFFGCIYLIKKKKTIFNFIDLNELKQLAKTDIDNDNICQCSKYISKITEVKDSLLSKQKSNCNTHISGNSPNNNSQNNTYINFDIIRGIKVNDT